MASNAAIQAASYWRLAGLDYLQYVTLSSDALRSSLKEPLKAAAMGRSSVHLRERTWVNGVPGERGLFGIIRILHFFCSLFLFCFFFMLSLQIFV